MSSDKARDASSGSKPEQPAEQPEGETGRSRLVPDAQKTLTRDEALEGLRSRRRVSYGQIQKALKDGVITDDEYFEAYPAMRPNANVIGDFLKNLAPPIPNLGPVAEIAQANQRMTEAISLLGQQRRAREVALDQLPVAQYEVANSTARVADSIDTLIEVIQDSGVQQEASARLAQQTANRIARLTFVLVVLTAVIAILTIALLVREYWPRDVPIAAPGVLVQ